MSTSKCSKVMFSINVKLQYLERPHQPQLVFTRVLVEFNWECWFLWREENRRTRRKNLGARREPAKLNISSSFLVRTDLNILRWNGLCHCLKSSRKLYHIYCGFLKSLRIILAKAVKHGQKSLICHNVCKIMFRDVQNHPQFDEGNIAKLLM